MSTVDELIRAQILEEVPQIMNVARRRQRVNDEINALTRLEFLERISDAIEQRLVNERAELSYQLRRNLP